MPINKNALLRYQVLDRCFRNPGKRYYIKDLLKACNDALFDYDPEAQGIKKRQLYEDIRFMESSQGWSIPLERIRDGQRTYLRYDDLDFSINNQPLNEVETEQLKSAMMVLTKFKGMPQFEWVNELMPKIDQSFNLTNAPNEIISFESNQFLLGLEYLNDFFNAIRFKQALEITYQSFKSNAEQSFCFHPYYLKQFSNRWYVFGKNQGFDSLTNLALDRCKKVEISSSEYDDSQIVNFEEYFDDFIGVTKSQDTGIQKIVLKAIRSSPPYIKSKPLHPSQKRIEETDKHYLFSIEVIPNYELEKLVLSYGEDIEVVEPKDFRDKIHSRIKSGLNNYK